MKEYEKIRECRENLRGLTNKKELYFTLRCNKAIDLAFQIEVPKLGAEQRNLLIQKEGGWITYPNYAKKYRLNLIRLDGAQSRQLNSLLKTPGILIMHSLPGYARRENMQKINEQCKKNDVLLINDCCGSIGTSAATFGDVVVCSFGKAKPLSAGGGGFIAADYFTNQEKELLLGAEKDATEHINFKALSEAISSLQERLSHWKSKKEEIEKKLKKEQFKVLNQGEGINILVSFNDEGEKERLIKFCNEEKLEHVECPRYIRTLSKAISIEIKRT
ncbi:MAG: DegT/DnrJ/EryC1/StrS family aminotransferase [Candidatus Nanoarchaeia archaeon]